MRPGTLVGSGSPIACLQLAVADACNKDIVHGMKQTPLTTSLGSLTGDAIHGLSNVPAVGAKSKTRQLCEELL